MRNLILFLILISLGTFTYYLEKALHDDLQNEESSSQLLQDLSNGSYGELTGFKTSKIDLIKRNSNFYSKGKKILIDSRRIEQVFKILSAIKVKKVINREDYMKDNLYNIYIPDESLRFVFSFEEETVSFVLGKKLEFDKTFYVEIIKGDGNRNIVIAVDSSIDEGIYSRHDQNAHASSFHYDRLQSLLYLEEDFFYDKRVFKNELLLKKKHIWSEVEVFNVRKKPFRVNLTGKKTLPGVFSGLSYLSTTFDHFFEGLLLLEGRGIYPSYLKTELKEKIGTLSLTKVDGRKQKLELYKNYEGKEGFFVSTSFDNILYEVSSKVALPLFYSNQQDFWNLTPSLPGVFTGEQLIQVKISFAEGGSFDLTLKYGEEFTITNNEIGGKSPNNKTFREFFDLLEKRADRASLVDEWGEEGERILKLARFYVQVDNQKIYFVFQDNQLILYNDKHKYKLHYFIGKNYPIKWQIKDYFF